MLDLSIDSYERTVTEERIPLQYRRDERCEECVAGSCETHFCPQRSEYHVFSSSRDRVGWMYRIRLHGDGFCCNCPHHHYRPSSSTVCTPLARARMERDRLRAECQPRMVTIAVSGGELFDEQSYTHSPVVVAGALVAGRSREIAVDCELTRLVA